MKLNVRILDISHYMICPPVSGGALRILMPFSKMNEDSSIKVDMLFFSHSQEHVAECKEYLSKIPVINLVEGVVSRMYTTPTDGKPKSISQDVYTILSNEMKDKAVAMVTENAYDIIQIEHSQSAWLVPFLRLASPKSKIVLDLHNAEYLIYERWLPYASDEDASMVRARFETMHKWEMKVWKWFDSAFTVSPIEQKMFQDVTGIKDTYLVPTGGGIDPGKYAPKENIQRNIDLLYIGTANWFPNAHGLLWFLDNVFDIILEKRPETRLYIAGYGDPDNEICRRAQQHPNIEFLGQIEDDVYYFQRSKVFIVPLWIGAGARVKIPTAWAAKLPVVSTTLGAEGAEAIHGENIMLADEPESFADCVLKLLDDSSFASQVAENAYKILCERYSLQYCADMLVDAYHELAAGSRDLEKLMAK